LNGGALMKIILFEFLLLNILINCILFLFIKKNMELKFENKVEKLVKENLEKQELVMYEQYPEFEI
jgi:hypothetical protein